MPLRLPFGSGKTKLNQALSAEPNFHCSALFMAHKRLRIFTKSKQFPDRTLTDISHTFIRWDKASSLAESPMNVGFSFSYELRLDFNDCLAKAKQYEKQGQLFRLTETRTSRVHRLPSGTLEASFTAL